MRIPRSRFVRQAGAIYVYQALSVAAAFVGSAAIARALGPQGKGTVDVFVLITTLVVEVCLLGITSGFLYHLANKGRPLREVHGDAIAVAIVLGLIGVALALAVPDFFASLVGDAPVIYVSLALALTGFFAYSASWATLMLGIRQSSAHASGTGHRGGRDRSRRRLPLAAWVPHGRDRGGHDHHRGTRCCTREIPPDPTNARTFTAEAHQAQS